MLLDPPPEVPAAGGRGWTRMLMILPMAAGAAAMGLMMGMQRGGVMTYVVGGMYGISILGMIAVMAVNQTGPGKREMIEARRQYMRRLAQLRAQVRATVRQQREAIHYRHPDPDSLWSTVTSGRLWERRRGDADFSVVRIGLGPQEVATPLIPPQTRRWTSWSRCARWRCAGSSPPTRWCPTCRWRSPCATSPTSTCAVPTTPYGGWSARWWPS
ncbi:hypothetical protein TPA0907_02770 [Micromonospora humidisoli]|nr:hypothetical protein TPA0907_02770 [Micromonospora sp. AKA109]